MIPSGHGGNPVFFNKKIKIGRPEHSLTPTPLRPINLIFPYTPPQSGHHTCITPNLKKRKNSQKRQPEVLCKKGVFKKFAKFTGKHLCQSLFFNKVAS